MYLPVTLCFAAAATLFNLFLAFRVSRIRMGEKVLHGDGGCEPLVRRMRAQANYVENTPFVLIMCGLVELANGSGLWLGAITGTFMVARVLHMIGMDSDKPNLPRASGFVLSALCAISLAAMSLQAVWQMRSMLKLPPPMAQSQG